ncbi:MAG: dihydroorotase, partial [Clostridia bacterium]
LQLMLKNATLYSKGRLYQRDVAYSQGQGIVFLSLPSECTADDLSIKGKLLIPGLVDVHVHLREPGFFYKETIASGTLAAARGGYTAVCAMPNVNPPPDTAAHVAVQQALIDQNARVAVYPYGCITLGQKGGGQLCDYAALKPHVAAFSDDGRGVQSESVMREAMTQIAKIGGLLAAHCEDESLLHGGCIHEGEYAKAHGLRGISSESEWRQVARDLKLVKETGCRYHVCHVSTKESVALIRGAKREGLDVSCETAPHYLLLCDEDLQEDGRFKMNPPIRARADREALVEGLNDGTIDVIATDHAPHSAEEKSRGLANSLMGVVGLECAFPVLYTGLVKTGKVRLQTLLTAMTDAPRACFGLPPVNLEVGCKEFAIVDLDAETEINPDEFASMGRATPFRGMHVFGRCELTIVGGKQVWQV